MNKKNCIKLIFLFSFFSNQKLFSTFSLRGTSFLNPRSQNTNAADNATGVQQYKYKNDWQTDTRNFYGHIATSLNYSHSYKEKRIAEYFFATDTLKFTGSTVTSRGQDDILADNFGLSTDFDGTIVLKPRIQTIGVQLHAYFAMDNITPGLYAEIHAPFVNTKWKMKLQETVSENGISTQFPALYMTAAALTSPVSSIKEALKGNTTFGHATQSLQFGKIDGSITKNAIADIRFLLGYHFIKEEQKTVGFNLQLVVPTGTKSKSEFLFEPIVGNGHHVELGVGLNSKFDLWEKDGIQKVLLHVDATMTHLFKSKQKRSFDFIENGFASRYLLLKEFDATGTYTEQLIPAINKTTLDCNVSVVMQLDFAIMARYHYTNWNFDFGYNGWIRTKEKISLKESIAKNTYGIKGIQDVSGGSANNTQSSATIHGNSLTVANQALLADTTTTFLTTNNIDKKSAANPLAITHKLFTHINYSWNNNNKKYSPFFGIGCAVEFEGTKWNDSEPNKNAISQVHFCAKGGIEF